MTTGRAWRLRIPLSSPIFGIAKANNVFEFLALSITLWLIIRECDALQLTEECILILGDSTFALGWLYKMGHIPGSSFYFEAVNMIA